MNWCTSGLPHFYVQLRSKIISVCLCLLHSCKPNIDEQYYYQTTYVFLLFFPLKQRGAVPHPQRWIDWLAHQVIDPEWPRTRRSLQVFRTRAGPRSVGAIRACPIATHEAGPICRFACFFSQKKKMQVRLVHRTYGVRSICMCDRSVPSFSAV